MNTQDIKNISCKKCNGAGRITCTKCNGKDKHMPGKMCSNCFGKGRTTCADCDGTGVIKTV